MEKNNVDVFKFKKHKMIPHIQRKFNYKFKEGEEIFVSFDGMTAYRGFIQEIHPNEHVTVLLYSNNTHYLYVDEVHYTPEMAVKYQVTS